MPVNPFKPRVYPLLATCIEEDRKRAEYVGQRIEEHYEHCERESLLEAARVRIASRKR